jgi:UDP-galactopyranose mutase
MLFMSSLFSEEAFRSVNGYVLFYETTGYDPESPYYPINTAKNKKILQKYKNLARDEHGVIIGGRLGDYAYYDMDKAILAALKCYKENICQKRDK